MSWIETIPYEKSTDKLRSLYNRIAGPGNSVDNIMMAHSLRPHTMVGHMTLYKNVLHHNDNTFPKWLLESIGTYVSLLNQCDYCVDHHFTGLTKLVGNERSNALRKAMEADDFNQVLPCKEQLLFEYAKELTCNASECELAFEKLKSENYTDGEILEINQVISYFNYANRTVLGLGVNTEGDVLGLSPNQSDNEENWLHQ